MKFFMGLYWMAICICRYMDGRWYIFRDAPQWYVEDIAGNKSLQHDAELSGFYDAAHAELAARRKQEQRK